MTRIFSAGAEAGSTAVFGGFSGTPVVSTTQKRTGAYSFYFNSNYGTVAIGTNKTILYFRIGLYLTGFNIAFGNNGTIVQLFDSAGAVQCSLNINQVTKALVVCRGSHNGTVLGTGVNSVPLNQWCCIEWYIKIDDGVAGESTVKLDGTTEITILAADTKATGNAGANLCSFGGATDGATYLSFVTGYYDDLAINDTAGAVNNSWIGRGGIYGIMPEAVGNYSDLIASAGNAWACIDEVPPSDADYVYESTVDKKSTYNLTVLTPTTGVIACINVIMRAKLDAVGTGNIARLIRSNGVDSQGADVGLDTSPKTIQDIIEIDPSGGGAWTIARVNALEAGAVVR
jgi:hypothetical protein